MYSIKADFDGKMSSVGMLSLNR